MPDPNQRPGMVTIKPLPSMRKAIDRVQKGESLLPDHRITSLNGQYFLILQKDGNLVLYKRANGEALWSSGARGDKAVMQTDGNFVLYAGPKAAWATGARGDYIAVQNDGNLVLYAGGKPAWNAGTWGGVKSGSHDSKNIFESFAATIGEGVSGIGSAAKSVGKVFKDVTQSPVWKVVAGAAVFIPGIGPAVSAGMVAAAALGKATSVKDAIMSTARTALPGGEAGKLGFDVATSIIVDGKGSINPTDLQYIRNQLPSGEAKAAFDTAFTMHAGRLTNQPAPAQLPPAAKAAYYTAKGGIKLNAPAEMRKATMIVATQHPAAKLGVKAALDSMKKLEGAELFEKLRLIAMGIEFGDTFAINQKRDLEVKAKAGDKQADLMLQMLAKADIANKVTPPVKIYRGPIQAVIAKIKNVA